MSRKSHKRTKEPGGLIAATKDSKRNFVCIETLFCCCCCNSVFKALMPNKRASLVGEYKSAETTCSVLFIFTFKLKSGRIACNQEWQVRNKQISSTIFTSNIASINSHVINQNHFFVVVLFSYQLALLGYFLFLFTSIFNRIWKFVINCLWMLVYCCCCCCYYLLLKL